MRNLPLFKKNIWTPLDHHVNQLIKEHYGINRNWIIAVSGGRDSVALFHCFSRIFRSQNLNGTPQKQESGKLYLAHIHHGPGDNLEFRDHAKKFCETLSSAPFEETSTSQTPIEEASKAKTLQVDFLFHQSSEVLRSESEMRNFRMDTLKKWQKEKQAIIVLAHHLDDLLETRLIRLIRGVSMEGWTSMHLTSHGIFRPFLGITRHQITQYLLECRQDFCEDPSNQDTAPLRNWIRQIWLPQLENKIPGSVKRMGESFENLALHLSSIRSFPPLPTSNDTDSFPLQKNVMNHCVDTGASFVNNNDGMAHFAVNSLEDKGIILRSYFDMCSIPTQQRILKKYAMMINQGTQSLTQGHLREILRQLDISKKSHIFICAGLRWSIDAKRISAKKKDPSENEKWL